MQYSLLSLISTCKYGTATVTEGPLGHCMHLISLGCLVHAEDIEQHNMVPLRRVKLGTHFQCLVPLGRKGEEERRGGEGEVEGMDQREGARSIDRYCH